MALLVEAIKVHQLMAVVLLVQLKRAGEQKEQSVEVVGMLVH